MQQTPNAMLHMIRRWLIAKQPDGFGRMVEKWFENYDHRSFDFDNFKFDVTRETLEKDGKTYNPIKLQYIAYTLMCRDEFFNHYYEVFEFLVVVLKMPLMVEGHERNMLLDWLYISRNSKDLVIRDETSRLLFTETMKRDSDFWVSFSNVEHLHNETIIDNLRKLRQHFGYNLVQDDQGSWSYIQVLHKSASIDQKKIKGVVASLRNALNEMRFLDVANLFNILEEEVADK